MKAGKVTYKLPVTMKGGAGVVVDGVKYKGLLVIERNGSGLNIVNKVDVEEYLKGVLKSEMSPSWPKEALKAQAVLARTYTRQCSRAPTRSRRRSTGPTTYATRRTARSTAAQRTNRPP